MSTSEYFQKHYLEHRAERLAYQREYRREYQKKGLRKPRKPRDVLRRKQRDHERYMEKRDNILAKQKMYRDSHKEEIKERRYAKGLLKVNVIL